MDPYGEVYPCVQWRRSVGNLHQRPIKEIWLERNQELAEVRRQNESAREKLIGLGQQASLLSFCPGMAEAATGDPTKIYPSAREKLELHQSESDSPRGPGLPVVS